MREPSISSSDLKKYRKKLKPKQVIDKEARTLIDFGAVEEESESKRRIKGWRQR